LTENLCKGRPKRRLSPSRAAIDVYGLPGDKTGGVGAEEQGDGRDFFNGASPIQRVLRGIGLPFEAANADRIHADTVWRKLAGALLRQSDHTGFAGSVADAFGQRAGCSGGGSKVDDDSAAFVRHDTPQHLGAEESAGQVDV